VKRSREAFKSYPPWLLLFFLLLVSVIRDARLLFRYPFAVGVNGYYYVLQVTQLVKTGRLYFSTHAPLALYALTPVAYLTGSATATIKVAGILLQSLLSIAVFAIIRTSIRNIWIALLGLALTLIPQSRLFMHTEYLSQLAALVLLVWAGWTAIRTTQSNHRIGILIMSALLVGAFFSHKSALVFALTLAACVLLMLAWIRPMAWKVVAMVMTMILWLSPAIILAQPFFTIPERFQSQLSFRPHWPFESALLAQELMLGIAASAVLFLIIQRPSRTRMTGFNLVFGSMALWSLLVTLNPFFNAQAMQSGVAGRSRMFSYIQVALLLPGLIWLVSSMRRTAAIYTGAVFVPLLILSAVAPLPHGLRPEFLARRGQLIQSLQIHAKEVAQDSIIIAPHGDQFVVTATIGIPAQQRPPESSNYGKVYWLLNDVRDQTVMRDATILIRNGDVATILMEDGVLQRSLAAINYSARAPLLRANPHLERTTLASKQVQPE